jgi:hypothetical protein
MLFETLTFLAREVNAYLDDKLGSSLEARVKLGNVALALDSNAQNGNALNGKAVMSLVNIEEDRATRTPTNRVKTATEARYKNPPVLLNLYVLFAVNKDYEDALKWLGQILTFFQHQKRFTPATHPTLDTRIEELSLELYTMNFEQVNHLWSTLGGKYLPSALYKIRQISLDEHAVYGEAGLIREIVLDQRSVATRVGAVP